MQNPCGLYRSRQCCHLSCLRACVSVVRNNPPGGRVDGEQGVQNDHGYVALFSRNISGVPGIRFRRMRAWIEEYMKCPRCNREFPESGEDTPCPHCKNASGGDTSLLAAAAKIIGALGLCVLVVCGVFLVVLAVLFVGCLVASGGRF